jgi:hypothetical protein
MAVCRRLAQIAGRLRQSAAMAGEPEYCLEVVLCLAGEPVHDFTRRFHAARAVSKARVKILEIGGNLRRGRCLPNPAL